MNRSYSKIRHIQESNKILEKRLLNEQQVSLPVFKNPPKKLNKVMNLIIPNAETMDEVSLDIVSSLGKSPDDSGCWYMGRVKGQTQDSMFKWEWDSERYLTEFRRSPNTDLGYEEIEYIIYEDTSSVFSQLCEEYDEIENEIKK